MNLKLQSTIISSPSSLGFKWHTHYLNINSRRTPILFNKLLSPKRSFISKNTKHQSAALNKLLRTKPMIKLPDHDPLFINLLKPQNSNNQDTRLSLEDDKLEFVLIYEINVKNFEGETPSVLKNMTLLSTDCYEMGNRTSF